MPKLAWGSVVAGIVIALVVMWFLNSRKRTKA